MISRKEDLAELQDRVSRGGKITVTRHSVPAAMPIPVDETRARMAHEAVVESMRELRNRIRPGKMNGHQMVEVGRGY